MKGILVHIVLLFLSITSIAQVKFETLVSSNKVSVGERIKITYKLNASGEKFRGPKLSGFQVLSGPNQSSSMQWVNGKTSHSLSYSYIVAPVKEGELIIPGAEIQVNGKAYRSNNVSITVTKAKAQPQAKSGQSQQKQGGSNIRSGNEIKDNLFIRVSANKRKAYVGEAISVTYQIYTRVNIVNNSIHKLPSFNGFWSQEVDIPNNAQLRQTSVNGVPYNVATLKKTILFPQQTGSLTIDPLALDVVIRVRDNRRPRSIFDQFFGGYKDLQYRIESNALTIDVKPVPTQNRPISFTGAVGNFSVKADLDKDSVAANEAINLKLTYSGSGNIKFIEKPLINFPPDFEVYDPKVNERIKTTGNGVSGSKSYEYLVIPRHAGKFEIEPITFSYFDPTSKTFKKETTQSFSIVVGRSEGEATAPSAYRPNPKKEDVRLLGQDIRYIKTGETALKDRKEQFFGTPLFYSGFALPSLAFLVFLFFSRPKNRSKHELLNAKQKRAGKVAQQRLKKARKALDANERNTFYIELLAGLNNYFSDKLTIPPADLTKESIRKGLNQKQLEESLINQALGLMDDCEMARYAPAATGTPEELLEKAESIIKKIEQHA